MDRRKIGYYLYEERYGTEQGLYPGVAKKIAGQIDIFSRYYDMVELQLKSKTNKVFKRIPFGSFLYRWNEVESKIFDGEFLYIRKPMIDAGFCRFICNTKKANPGIKVLLEIPTYPYDKEQFRRTLSSLPFYFKEKRNRKHLKGLVDKIVTYSEESNIFGIETIRIQNGLDITNIPVAEYRENNSDSINLIAVATLQAYHGYERVINGLRNYYRDGAPKKSVIFHIVGTGSAEDELRRLVSQYQLEGKVVFHGNKTGDELTKLFDLADAGMGSFGMYKIELDSVSSLKTREYIARGLPVIAGCSQDIFKTSPCEFHLEFPNNESAIDINLIVDFCDRTYSSRNHREVAQVIRQYAERNVTINRVFLPVIEYLNC